MDYQQIEILPRDSKAIEVEKKPAATITTIAGNGEFIQAIEAPKATLETVGYTNITVNPTSTTNSLSSQVYLAGEDISAYTLVRISGGAVFASTGNNTDTTGLILQDVVQGHTTNVVSEGLVVNPQWDWDLLGAGKVFMGVGGSLIQSPDFNLDVLQEVATILDSDRLYIDIQEPTIIT